MRAIRTSIFRYRTNLRPQSMLKNTTSRHVSKNPDTMIENQDYNEVTMNDYTYGEIVNILNRQLENDPVDNWYCTSLETWLPAANRFENFQVDELMPICVNSGKHRYSRILDGDFTNCNFISAYNKNKSFSKLGFYYCDMMNNRFENCSAVGF
jgi:hypothetical protein